MAKVGAGGALPPALRLRLARAELESGNDPDHATMCEQREKPQSMARGMAQSFRDIEYDRFSVTLEPSRGESAAVVFAGF